jgi:hypothetical protein
LSVYAPTAPGRDLDARVAEQVMRWERVTLFERSLQPEFFTGGAAHMYGEGVPALWLVPPGTDVSGGVGVSEQIGELRIGHGLPFYSIDMKAAVGAAEDARRAGRIATYSLLAPTPDNGGRWGAIAGLRGGDLSFYEPGESLAHALVLALLTACTQPPEAATDLVETHARAARGVRSCAPPMDGMHEYEGRRYRVQVREVGTCTRCGCEAEVRQPGRPDEFSCSQICCACARKGPCQVVRP